MQISRFTNNKLVSISVRNKEEYLEEAKSDPSLIYVLKGNLQLTINNRVFQLGNSDFVLVQSNQTHSICSKEDCIYIFIRFNYSELNSLLANDNFLYECNSVEYKKSSDVDVRNLIEDLLFVYLNQSKFSQLDYLERCIKLISTIKKHYIVNANVSLLKQSTDKEKNKRVTEILSYVQQNFREQLTLEEVATLHLVSSPYLSKIFKKQTGKTFTQYIQEVRLAHAVNDLIYSNKTITRTALENGFPNLASFNRVFFEQYKVNPGQYIKEKRKELKEKEVFLRNDEKKEDLNALKDLRKYLSSTRSKQNQILVQSRISHTGEADTISKYWNRLLNIGYVKDFINSDMQEQIMLLKNELGFTYARFWGLFSNDMHVEDHSGENTVYNFTNINKLLDFLISNKIKPFIELGPKPKLISKSVEQVLIVQNNKDRSLEEWSKLIKAFLLHCVERYGIDEVMTWYFEVWSIHMDLHINHHIQNKDTNLIIPTRDKQYIQKLEEYFKVFTVLKKHINEFVPSAKVGGCGLGMTDNQQLNLLLKQWKLQEVQPDFLSVYVYPIEDELVTGGLPIKNKHSSNPNLLLNKLSIIRSILVKEGLEDLELNVTEWNISISNRDYLNDSCFKASYIVKNIIDNINENKVNMLGYWLSSDIFSDYRDSKLLLHGGAGLLTKSSIKKPSYYAFTFLNKLGDKLVAKGESYIITRKSRDRYQALLFNYKHFNDIYYLHPEASTAIDKQYDIFENTETIKLNLEVKGITNGKYRVKELIHNRQHGSILDNWLKFGIDVQLKQDEVEYLRQITVPYMKVNEIVVENNVVKINRDLEAHEIRLVELQFIFEQ